MSKNLGAFLLIALLVSGCSFLQDWSEFRDGDGEDAGPQDAGTDDAGTDDAGTDAGFDAGPDACNDCPSEGCGTASPECLFDPTDMCFHCVTEGARCVDDGECEGELICEFGRCLYECNTGAECPALGSESDECVPSLSPGRNVCINHECDPVAGDCEADQICAAGLPVGEPAELASICAYATGATAGQGESCTPASLCGPRLACVDVSGDGTPTCQLWCAEASACDAGTVCELGGPTGMLTYQGTTVGVCADPCATVTCGPTERCVWDGTTPSCTISDCATNSDCRGGSRCMWGRCLSTCVIGGAPCGGSSVCVAEMVCLDECPSPATRLCADGSSCMDLNGDAIFDCIP